MWGVQGSYTLQNPTACLVFWNRFLHVRAELGEETLPPAVLHGVYQQFSMLRSPFFLYMKIS